MIILSQKDQHYYTYCIATNPEEETYMLKTIKTYGPPTYDVETRSWLIPKNCYDELANSKFVKQKTGSGLKLSLFNYQEEVVNFCLNKKDALIVLPCGSGKQICRSEHILSDTRNDECGMKRAWCNAIINSNLSESEGSINNYR